MSVVLGARDAATGRRYVQYLDRASAQGGRVGAVDKPRLSVPQSNAFGGDGEYTGGFRLVDMSETVKEKDEEGNEVDKVVPKIAVMGVTDPYTTTQYDNGTLFFSSGNVLTKCKGVTVDLSKAVKNKPLNVFAYWTGSAGGIYVALSDDKTATKRELDKLMATMYIIVGTFTVTGDNTVDKIVQLFYNDVADFCQDEYTGGFRLVDMSEVVVEKGEDGKETEKVVPKLGVLGIDPTETNKMGTLYYSVGGAVYTSSGITFDLSNATKGAVLHAYACWNGITGSVVVTTKDSYGEISTMYAAHVLVHIGTFKVTSNGVTDIKQLFFGSEVSFHYMQPYLANIGDGSPESGYNASLTAYPTPDNPKESFRSGRVFLSTASLVAANAKPTGFITVHPVSVKVLEGNTDGE